jgi:hypothetical protein
MPIGNAGGGIKRARLEETSRAKSPDEDRPLVYSCGDQKEKWGGVCLGFKWEL